MNLDRLRANRDLRNTYHALRIAPAVQPSLRYLGDVITRHPEGTYRARRTGHRVTLRPRLDLQVAREQLSRRGYEPPAEVQALLDAQPPRRILDLGANIGLFVLSASHRHPGAEVLAVEPDPDNRRLAQRNIDQNGLCDRVRVIAAAAGTSPGTARFAAGQREISRVVTAVADEVDTIDVDVVDTFDLARGCDFVKIDIEGSEWPLLRDARFAALEARVVVLEWHALGADTTSPAAEAERLLRAAGFEARHNGRPLAEAGEIWAYRP